MVFQLAFLFAKGDYLLQFLMGEGFHLCELVLELYLFLAHFQAALA